MIHDSTPYRVLKISELARFIAGQLILIHARNSAVNLACACRSFEEPILSTLWETQWSLIILLKVLPEEICKFNSEKVVPVLGDPSPGDWNRVKRYASWMRQASIAGWMFLGEEIFNKLRLNSPPGGWFPALQDLSWCITESNLPYGDLFFSPHLKRISIRLIWSWTHTIPPPCVLSTLLSTISALPTSSLERILVHVRYSTWPWAQFKDTFSSIVLRCGPLFTEYDSPVPLSNAALEHLIQLPHLRTWRIHGPPPTYPTSYLPLGFPPLRELTLGEGAVHGWLQLLRRLEESAVITQGMTPLSKTKESLKVLNVEDTPGISIDAPSVSTIQYFRNLVHLNVGVYCYEEGEDRCIFKLNNDNVAELAMALTQLEFLFLGHPCPENTCLTTVACLVPISIHCNNLSTLGIHFNTTNIVDDFKNALEDSRFLKLLSLPRCSLKCLDVCKMPLSLDESGYKTVAEGMINIFPSLVHCEGLGRGWGKLRLSRRNLALPGALGLMCGCAGWGGNPGAALNDGP